MLPEDPFLGRPITHELCRLGPLAAGVGGLALCDVVERDVLVEDWSCDGSGCEERDGAGECGEVHVDDGCEVESIDG